MEINNSATRLLNVLGRIQSGALGQQLTLIMRVEKAKKGTSYTMVEQMRAVIELNDLYDQFITDILNSSLDKLQRTAFLDGLTALEKRVRDANPSAAFQPVSEAERALLVASSTFLATDQKLSEEDLKLIRQSIAEFRETVYQLPDDNILLSVLLELIRHCEDAVSRYEIYGPSGLKNACKGVLTEVVELYMSDSDALEEVKSAGVIDAVSKLYSVVDKLSAKYNQYAPMLQLTAPMIENLTK